MKKAYSYVRFSTPEQRKGDSLRRQLASTERYCEEHNLTLDTTLTLRDLGVSAFRGKNIRDGALGVFLKAVETGQVPKGSVLIVENLDRLTRADVLTAQELFIRILRSGLELVTLMDSRRYTEASVIANPMDLMASILVMMRAHEESLSKSFRSTQAWQKKFAKAAIDLKPFTARCPAWLRLNPTTGRFEQIQERTAVLRRIAELATGGRGQCRIAATLNREGIKPFQKKKIKWNEQAIKFLLSDRALIGEVKLSSGKVLTNYYPAVLTEPQFFALRAAVRSRHHSGFGSRGEKDVVNLFGRKIISAADGGAMLVRHGVRCRKLISQEAFSGGSWAGFNYDIFEEHFLQWVSEVSFSKPPAPIDRTTELTGRIVEVQSRIDQTKRALDGAKFKPDLLEVLEKFTGQKEELQKQLEDEKGKSKAVPNTAECRNLVKELAGANGNRDEVRLALRLNIGQLIQRVVLYMGDKGDHDKIGVAQIELADGSHRWLAIRKQRYLPAVSFGTVHAATTGKTVDGDKLVKRLTAEWSLWHFAEALGFASVRKSDFVETTGEVTGWIKKPGNLATAKADLDTLGAVVESVEQREDGATVIVADLGEDD